MHRTKLVNRIVLGSAVCLIGCSDDNDNQPAGPVTETFRATMNGANERPDARTTPATGTAEFIFRRDTLYWTLTLTGITNVTASHIHAGSGDVAGGVILPLTPPISNTSITGFITRSAFVSPGAPNQALTFDGLLDLMRSGGSYVNVHTNNTANDPTNNSGPGDFPGGEIRGQVAKIS
jgi:CHRD domain